MIKAKDLISLVKVQLQNWNISRNEDALYQYLNMGIIDLYEKFNIGLRIETISVAPEQAVYQLKSDDANLVIQVYDENGVGLNSGDVIGGKEWDYKLVNYRTFIYNNKDNKEKLLYALYKSSPIQISDEKDVIDLPDAFKEAIMLYMMYLGTMTIRSDASKDGGSWDTRSMFMPAYTQKCAELLQFGYKVSIDSEGMPIYAKGYR